MSSAIKTPAFQAKAGNIQNEDNSSIYSGGAWSFKNASAVTGFHVDADGKVGIGTTSPVSKVHVFGPVGGHGTSVNPPNGAIVVSLDGGSAPGNYGAGITFSQRFAVGSATQITVGQIVGVKTNSDGSFGGGLAFLSAPNGASTLSERMRLDADGNLNISGGGSLLSESASVSCPNNTATLLFDAHSSANVNKVILLNVWDTGTNIHAFATIVISNNGGSSSILYLNQLVTGSSTSVLTTSGSNVFFRHTFGSTRTIRWSYVRIG